MEWISADRSIGATDYDLIDQAGRTRHVRSLVFLGGHRPNLDYRQTLLPSPEVTGANAKIHAQSSVGEAIIRDWKLTYGLRGNAIGFSNEEGKGYRVEADAWSHQESLAGKKSGVCMRYPDQRRTWIIELPSARARYGAQMERHFGEAIRSIPESDRMRPSLEQFAETGVIDVNQDGLYDYPSLGILSYRGAYFALRRQSEQEQELDEFGKLVFEGNGETCELDPPDAIFLVADDASVYLNRKCNLTQLSR